MVRIAKAVSSKKRRDKIRKRSKGFWGDRKNHIGLSKSAIMKADAYNYVHRKALKRDMRSLWIVRLNIASRYLGVPYNRLIKGLSLADVKINRKMMSELAINDFPAFKEVVDIAKKELAEVNLESA